MSDHDPHHDAEPPEWAREFMERMKAVPPHEQQHIGGPSRFSDPMTLPGGPDDPEHPDGLTDSGPDRGPGPVGQ